MTKQEQLEKATAAYAHAWDDPWDDVISPALAAEAEAEAELSRIEAEILKRLEKKVADTKAAADDAWDDTTSLANVATYILSHTDYADYASFVNTEAAYLKARAELKEYKEQDNE